MAARTAALLLAAVMLTACQARLTVDISVDVRGGGEVVVSLGADEALLAHAEHAGSDPLGELAATGEALAHAGWETADVVAEDGSREVSLRVGFEDAAEFNDVIGRLAEALAAPEVTPLESLRLDVGDERLRLVGAAGLEPGAAVTELGLQPDQAVALVTERDAFRYEITATLPGEVLSTTAEQEQMPLRWEIQPGEHVEVVAVTELPTRRWWLPVLLVVAVVLGGGWAMVAVRRR